MRTLFSINSKMSNFQGVEDRYNGITVDSSIENCSSQEFSNKLQGLLSDYLYNVYFLHITYFRFS